MQGLTKSLIPQKAFDIFQKVEQSYKDHGSLSNEDLETLHSYFGEPLIEATEILEKCKIIRYSTRDLCLQVFELSTFQEKYVIFENVNFCHCAFFTNRVLDGQLNITCKHVLAVHLAKIQDKFKKETLEENIFVQYLNSQLAAYLDTDTQLGQ